MNYSEKVMDHFNNPRNAGIIENADAISEIGNPECGDMMKLYLKVNDQQTIVDAKFQTYGCAAAIACSSMTTIMAIGKKIDIAEKLTKKDIADALDGLPPIKMHCSNLGADALRLAIRNYKKTHNIPVEDDLLDHLHEEDIMIPKDSTENIDKELDLKGKQCPMTFVYTKVALESMNKNQILKVILDFKPAFMNVPNSVKKQNLGEIMKEVEENGIKTLWIRRL